MTERLHCPNRDIFASLVHYSWSLLHHCSQLLSFLFLIENVTFLIERLGMIVWRWVLVYTGGREASERGKGKKREFGGHRRKIGNVGLAVEWLVMGWERRRLDHWLWRQLCSEFAIWSNYSLFNMPCISQWGYSLESVWNGERLRK